MREPQGSTEELGLQVVEFVVQTGLLWVFAGEVVHCGQRGKGRHALRIIGEG
jgi:hypothetical protein